MDRAGTPEPPESSSHRRFEDLAVQHVLGGLDREDANHFRDHLAGCAACRQRVVELRGIAADLDAAAREERARARTKVETARREPDEGGPAPLPTGRFPTAEAVRNAIAALALVAVTVLAFWNVHLQAVRAQLEASLAERGAVLDTLVAGEPVEADVRVTGMRAVVAVDGDDVALNASGVPRILDDRRVVLWGVEVDGSHTPVAVLGPTAVPDGRVVVHVPDVPGVAIVLSLEPWPLGPEPTGTVVLRADLR